MRSFWNTGCLKICSDARSWQWRIWRNWSAGIWRHKVRIRGSRWWIERIPFFFGVKSTLCSPSTTWHKWHPCTWNEWKHSWVRLDWTDGQHSVRTSVSPLITRAPAPHHATAPRSRNQSGRYRRSSRHARTHREFAKRSGTLARSTSACGVHRSWLKTSQCSARNVRYCGRT